MYICYGYTMIWFYELHYRELKLTAICCAEYRNESCTGLLKSRYLLSGTFRQIPTVEWHLLKIVWSQILHFRHFHFYSRQVCNKRLAKRATLTLNGFAKNAKYGFNSCKSSNLAWKSSSSLAIYFCVLSLCGLQSPLREKNSFSFCHWKNDRMLSTIRLFENLVFCSGNLSSQT